MRSREALRRLWLVPAVIAALAAAPAAHAADVPLTQGFESGADAWSASGQWRIQSAPQAIAVSPAINPLLVSLADAGFLPAPTEGASVAWFGEPATGSYCGSGFAAVRQSPKNGCTSAAPQRGSLTSPEFSLAGYSQAFLEFDTWWEIEAVNADSADQMHVQVSGDGGASWNTVKTLNPADSPWGGVHQAYGNDGARSSGAWERVRANISSAAGNAGARVRLVFDTVDARRNGFRGWLVDRLAVVDGSGTPVDDDVTGGFADPGTPVVTLRDASSQPNGDGTHQVTFTVGMNHPSPKPVKVDYNVDDSVPARVGEGTVEFPPGSTVRTETLTVPESSQPPFRVALANPLNAALGAAAASVDAVAGAALVSGPGGDQLVLGVRQESDLRPQLGRTVQITRVSGEIRYKLPNGRYTPLPAGTTRLVPLGTIVDARRGHVSLVVENGEGQALQQGEFWEGIFGIFQASQASATTELRLGGGDYRQCLGPARRRAGGSAARVVRRLWGKSTGRFRTKGRFAAATVRGTEWETADLCLATRVTVREGAVVVRDFRRQRNIVVRAGDSATVAAARTGRYRKRSGLNRSRISRG